MLNIIERIGARLARLLSEPINTNAAIIMGIYTLVWGVWLGNPFWTVFDQAPLYSWLDSVAPEWYWGIQAVIVGAFMIWGILRHTYSALTMGAFIGFIHWGAISTGYFIGDWQNTGGLTSGMIAFYCGFVYLNLRVNRDNLHFEKEKGTL